MSTKENKYVEWWCEKNFIHGNGEHLQPVYDQDIGDGENDDEIVLKIRNEILNQVCQEVVDDLPKTHADLSSSLAPGMETDGTTEQSEMDLKIAKGLEKIKRLDGILSRRIQREREIKREGLALKKRLREELEMLQSKGASQLKEVKNNTAKFLALSAPESSSRTDDECTDYNPTPIFKTEFTEDDVMPVMDKSPNSSRDYTKGNVGKDNASQNGFTEDTGSTSIPMSTTTTSKNSSFSNRAGRKDFIKRNAELAAMAGETIPLTDDEKARISCLLADLDDIPEENEQIEDSTSDNPFRPISAPGEGFTPDRESKMQLEDIDNRLRSLLPPDEFLALQSAEMCSPRSFRDDFQACMVNDTIENESRDVSGPGEKVLKELRYRDKQNSRLQWIDEELQMLHSAVASEIEYPRLSELQIRGLLDECNKVISRASSRQSDISERNRDSPKLPRDVLDRLLEEAQTPLGGRSVRETSSTYVTHTSDSLNQSTVEKLLENSRATSRAISLSEKLTEQTDNTDKQSPSSSPDSADPNVHGFISSDEHNDFIFTKRNPPEVKRSRTSEIITANRMKAIPLLPSINCPHPLSVNKDQSQIRRSWSGDIMAKRTWHGARTSSAHSHSSLA